MFDFIKRNVKLKIINTDAVYNLTKFSLPSEFHSIYSAAFEFSYSVSIICSAKMSRVL
jgi:hypothetical protein